MKYRRPENNRSREALEMELMSWPNIKTETKEALKEMDDDYILKLYDTMNPVKIRKSLQPVEYVDMLLEEMINVIKSASKLRTGSIDQRVLFVELQDLSKALAEPSSLEEIRLETTNSALYDCPVVNWG